jgi:hypothetical protein
LNNPVDFFVFTAVLRPSEVLEFLEWTPASGNGVDVYLAKSVDSNGPRLTLVAIAPDGVDQNSLAFGTIKFSVSQEVQLSSDLPLSFGQLASRDGEVWSVRVQGKPATCNNPSLCQ